MERSTGNTAGEATVKYTVEMFGLSPFTEANAVEVELKGPATLRALLRAVAAKMPALKGRVIETDRLVENYGIYINGQFISDHDDTRVSPTDRVVIILLAVGG